MFFKSITTTKLILLITAFIVCFSNYSFYQNVLNVYPLNFDNAYYLLTLVIVLFFVHVFVFSLVCVGKFTKIFLIIMLFLSAQTSYFMNTYAVIIDDSMIENVFNTDLNESLDLLSWNMALYLLGLGLLPSLLVWKIKITKVSFKRAFISRTLLLVSSLVVILAMLLSASSFYASFFREHKPLRYYTNPSYTIYSLGKFTSQYFETQAREFEIIAPNPTITKSDNGKRKLIVLVVGETARADHFSLNGYPKETNPKLKEMDIFNFDNTSSCATTTALSVPCMFSVYDRDDFTPIKAATTENVLDILNKSGVNVLWLDNNSSSKGVADRVGSIDFKSSDTNPICDPECRDMGMLVNLQDKIDDHKTGDIVVVLHQMGNHGPAYYKRYPKEFEKFTPVCETNELSECSSIEINNAYDNAILYTDHFLSEIITLLKEENTDFNTGMIYMSDHGESLGENNLYLHGLPYFIAPKVQTHVPFVMWFNDSFKASNKNIVKLNEKSSNEFSHDNLFHTLLGLLDVKTVSYVKSKDIINN